MVFMPSRHDPTLTVVSYHSRSICGLVFSCSQEQLWVDRTGIAQNNGSLTLLMYAYVLHTFM